MLNDQILVSIIAGFLSMFKNSAKEILALLKCNKSDMHSEEKIQFIKKNAYEKCTPGFEPDVE